MRGKRLLAVLIAAAAAACSGNKAADNPETVLRELKAQIFATQGGEIRKE